MGGVGLDPFTLGSAGRRPVCTLCRSGWRLQGPRSGRRPLAIVGLVAGEASGGPSGVNGFSGGLAVVLDDEKGRATQPLLEALLVKRSGDHPPEIRALADRLLQDYAPWALDLGASAAKLIEAAGNERDRRLFVGASLGLDTSSLGQLARREGISATRASQIIRRAEDRVTAALTTSSGALPWAVRVLRSRLGTVTTEEHLTASLAGLGAVKSPAAELTRWLAGPWSPVTRRPGWVAVEPTKVVAPTVTCLGADGGVRRLADVEAELADSGIHSEQLDAWLAAAGATVVHDVVVSVTGPLADAVERLLDAHGTARTVQEISADLAEGGRLAVPTALKGTLRQRRFAPSAAGAFGLSAWGPAAQQQAAKRPRRRPRSARAGRPGPHRSTDQPRRGPKRLWLWVRVDEAVLRGSAAAVPAALVEGLAVMPRTRRTFSSRWGPVTLAHEGPHPTRGSVRAIALAAGARPDDTLLLGFSGTANDVAVEVRAGAGPTISPEGSDAAPVLFPDIVTGGTP
jgi:hypothetical protein